MAYLDSPSLDLTECVVSQILYDKDFREPAKAHNCYTRKVSDYLPQWAPVEFEPFFKRDYDSSFLYFELTDELKTNRDAFKKYADHVLKMMYNSK